MLQNTFLHIPYVNEKTEKLLWNSRIRCWDDFLSCNTDIPNRELMKKFICVSKKEYDNRNHEFFSRRLLSRYHWRAYPDFKDSCCYLDIETTGLSKEANDLTMIGLYDGSESKVFINGVNLGDFEKEIGKYSYIVTFNGSLFDIPFIKAKFPDINFNHMHADLRFILKSLGYNGGLKNIEKQVGLARDSDISDMSGKDAVKLWYKYKYKNDQKALDLLVKYNTADIENLKTLMDFGYDKLRKNLDF